MYCSTCGAPIVEGRSRCDTCGTAVHRMGSPAERMAALPAVPVSATCPRCGYRGEGITYFTRGTHVAALVGVTLLTAGMMGAGGLVYYLLRRDHIVCPRCGSGWGKDGMHALVPMTTMAGAGTLRGAPSAIPTRGAGASAKQGWAVFLFLLAALLTVVAIASTSIQPLLVGGVAAAGGFALQRVALQEREQRRQALLSALQLPVLQLAGRQGGELTVTQVAAELGWTLRRAEKVLQSLDDGLRVTSEVTDEGVIVYQFPELIRPPHPTRLPPLDG
jgi:hypothetical protein